MYVVVIGGANIDIGGRPYAPLILSDSNPGKITTGCGGVGRNIAHALSKLGVKVYLVTALGDDYAGKYIKKYCEDEGIDMSYSITVPKESSSMYLYINENDGDMALALSHMDIVSYITPEYIESLNDLICGSQAVVMDCNVSQDVFLKLKSICSKNCKNIEKNKTDISCNAGTEVPLYIDPVSTAHAHKIKGHLDGIDTIKPNRLEAEFLTDISINTEDDFKAAASELIRQGVKRVFITMGEGGMMAADKDACFYVGGYPAEIVSTTGAGDTATAAIVWASLTQAGIYNNHQNILISAAKAANAAASISVSSTETISPDLSINEIINIAIKEIYNE